MKIAINAIRVSRQGGGGIDHYVSHLINQLSILGVDFDLYTLAPEHFHAVDSSKIICPFPFKKKPAKKISPAIEHENSKPHRNSYSFRRWLKIVLGDTVKVWWTQIIFPFYLIKNKYDILFSPSQLDALFLCPSSVKQIIAVLDLIPFVLKDQKHRNRIFLNAILPAAIKKSSHIITISENTKKDVEKLFGVPSHKITATLLAKPEVSQISQNPTVEKIHTLKEKYCIDQYILCLSGNDPHKNLQRLIQAYSLIKEKTNLIFVIAGFQNPKEQWKYEKLVQDKNLSNRVKFLGRISEQELPALYKGASLFVFPSLYEGFGLPPLEALSHGIPVTVSHSSSLPEVVGDAGIYFDPMNPYDMADKIIGLLNNKELMEQLRKTGPIQAKKFSWEKTAKKTLEVFNQVYSS